MADVKSAILSVIGSKVLSKAKVVLNETVSEHFHFIDLESESLVSCVFMSGRKIQIDTGDWVLRTYTPISIDSKRGVVRVLAFLPGKGPGSAWAQSVKVGTSTHFKGPDGSKSLHPDSTSLSVFGDETTFGLAIGLDQTSGRQNSSHFAFEVSKIKESETVLQTLGLKNYSLHEKSSSFNLEFLKLHTQSVSDPNHHQWVIAGKAQTIQTIRSHLKSLNAPMSQLITKAYWAEGKKGLD
jgi:ferric-chelate reductase (NADPH)